MTEINILLRHILATIAYRLTKSIHKVDAGFYNFETANGVRKPGEIIYHIAVIMGYFIAKIDKKEPEKLVALNQEEEVKRFFGLLEAADELLKDKPVEIETAQKLIQGPLAGILTHIGQIALLRRYYNKPITRENFMQAKILIGNVVRESQQLNNELLE